MPTPQKSRYKRMIERRWRSHLPTAIQERDLSLFRAVAESNISALDATLPRLSRSANHSALWLAIALALGATGDRQNRRAALRGVLAIAITSATTNLPAKLAFRRPRPDATIVPLARRLRRMPASTSFPSGHSASAIAFAVGVGMEQPALAAPLGALSAAVAFSRIYTGAHYPSDVLVGAAIGAGLATATKKFFPLVSPDAAQARPTFAAGVTDPSERGKGFGFVVNGNAGGADPTDALADALADATVVRLDEDGDLVEELTALGETVDALGVVGGDGSINAAAQIAHERRLPLAVVPGGTLNHFARDLGLDSIDDAIEAVQKGETVAVDLGLIDGKPFLNTASFGTYAEVVDERERHEARIGKWPALLLAIVRVLRRRKPVDVEINGIRRSVWMIFIGNCRYVPSGFAPTRRERLDDRLFDVRIVSADRPFALTRFLFGLVTGRLERSAVYEETLESELKIRSHGGPMRLARDGETFDGSEVFSVTKADRPLAVYRPVR